MEGAPSRKFAHLARWTLDALHRAIWISTPSDPGAGSVVNWSWENESVMESTDGRQRRREFVYPDASDRVVIRYLSPSAEAGDRVEIQNPWCGYEASFIVVDTLERAIP